MQKFLAITDVIYIIYQVFSVALCRKCLPATPVYADQVPNLKRDGNLAYLS